MKKKKKKGFTLIELLAVIVILAIIALITVPLITGVVEKARKGSVKDTVLGMFDAAGIYYAQHMTEPLIDNKITFTCNGEKCKTPSNGELKFKGQIPTSGSIIIDKSGYTEAIYIKVGKYCALGNRTNLDVQNSCEKLDITKPEFSISVGSTSSKSIMIGVNATDEESNIKKIEYMIDGKTYIDNYNDIEVNTTKTFNNLKANKEYRIKVTVTNGNDIKETKEINATTKDLGSLVIKYNNTPAIDINGYLKSQEAYLEYSDNDAVGYYIKLGRHAISNKDAVKVCGSDTMPGECSDIDATTSISEGNWYYFNESPTLAFTTTVHTTTSIYAIATNGISNTALTSGTISKTDDTTPTIRLGGVTSTTDSITINYSLILPGSGGSVECLYGTSLGNETSTNNVTVNDNSCVITGLNQATTYYFKLKPRNGFNEYGRDITSSKKTDKITYTITYNYNGGSASNPTTYDIETPTFTLNNPTRSGYDFNGWTGSGSGTTITIPTGSTGNRSYTANWKAACRANTKVNSTPGFEYTAYYNANGQMYHCDLRGYSCNLDACYSGTGTGGHCCGGQCVYLGGGLPVSSCQ